MLGVSLGAAIGFVQVGLHAECELEVVSGVPPFVHAQHLAVLLLRELDERTGHVGAGGIPELVTHGEHGVVCRAGDSADLLEAVRWALRHPDAMRRMAHNARRRAADFPEQRMTDEMLALLEETARAR